MRGVYSVVQNYAAVAAAKYLLTITAPTDKVVEIISASITNASNETNEQLIATIQRTTGAGTGTNSTASKHEVGDQAAGSTVKNTITVDPTPTANTEIGMEGFSSLAGWYFEPTPEERPIIGAGLFAAIRITTATFTALDLQVRLTFREIG